jgi:hypothetical protein
MISAFIVSIFFFMLLMPIFPVSLDIDEQGIRKKIPGKVILFRWSDISELHVTEKGGFRGRGGFIRFIRRGSSEIPKLPDLSPAMFGSDAPTLAAVIREGMKRWGSTNGIPERVA